MAFVECTYADIHIQLILLDTYIKAYLINLFTCIKAYIGRLGGLYYKSSTICIGSLLPF